MRNLAFVIAVFLPMLVAFFLFLPLKFRVKLLVAPNELGEEVYIKPPLSPWFIPLPMPKRKVGHRAGAPKPKRPNVTGFKVKSTVKTAQRLLATLKEISSAAIKVFSVERLWVFGKIGTGDAFGTAIAAGSLSSASGVALSVLRRKGVSFSANPKVRFVPDYSEPIFRVKVDAIISASVWSMAKVGFSLRRIVGPQIRAVRNVARNQVSKETVEY